MSRIMDVDAVEVRPLIGHEHLCVVVARGKVPTTGWSDIVLSRFIYIVPPSDGIMDFDFIGKPPTGAAGDLVIPVSADALVSKPSWLKGVRVFAKANSKEVLLAAAIPIVEG